VQVQGARVGSQSATSRRLLQQGVGSSIVINGCTQGWTMSPTGSVQYHFSTPDGFVCQTDENMKWGCKLNNVVVFAIPVTILPISKMHSFSRPDFAVAFTDRFGSDFSHAFG
jgi:hypothetical protein